MAREKKPVHKVKMTEGKDLRPERLSLLAMSFISAWQPARSLPYLSTNGLNAHRTRKPTG